MTNSDIRKFFDENWWGHSDSNPGFLPDQYADCVIGVTRDARVIYNYEKMCLKYAFLKHIPYDKVYKKIMPGFLHEFASSIDGTIPVFTVMLDDNAFESNDAIRAFLRNDEYLTNWSNIDLLDDNVPAFIGVTLAGESVYDRGRMRGRYIREYHLMRWGSKEDALFDEYVMGFCGNKQTIIVDMDVQH